jgi:hypothetical protein
MKGQAEVMEPLVFVLFAVLFIGFLVIVLPNLLGNMYKLFSLTSAEVVAKEIAGFISVSGVAPHKITIYYSPGTLIYDVGVDDRLVRVNLLNKDNSVKEKSVAEKTAVDPFLDEKSVNYFTIMKYIRALEYLYDIKAYKKGEST